MNARRTRKAWKKLWALMLDEPSGFGEITPRERKAAIEYWARNLRILARTSTEAAKALRDLMTAWREGRLT